MKEFIKNGKDLKICVELLNAKGEGLAIIMHGFGGNKDQPHIRTFADSFLEKGFKVLLFDTTNTFGESEGKYEDATITTSYNDLVDVITWAKKQSWFESPFYLAGHSLGEISTALYAENYPSEVKGLAPISTVVSGKLSLESPKSKNNWRDWKEKGEHKYMSSGGFEKRVPWTHYEDRLNYDLLINSTVLKMPVLMIVGDSDESTPVEHQKIFYDSLGTDKELHIIKDAPHTFKKKEHLDEIKEYFVKWIDKVENMS